MTRYIYHIIVFPFFLSFLFSPACSQIQQGGFPYSYNNDLYKNIPVIHMPKLSGKDTTSEVFLSGYKTYPYAFVFEVTINPENSGRWINLDDGRRLWQAGINSEGAFSLSLFLDGFKLPAGASLFVFGKDYEFIAGAFTSHNNNESNVLAIRPLPVDVIFIELLLPDKSADYSINISKVAHDFKNLLGNQPNRKWLKSDGDCNEDINCEDGKDWKEVKNAVFRLLVYNTGSSKYESCTGTLVNNAGNENKPYFITAGHCLFNEAGAKSLVAIFDHENFYCGGPEKSSGKSISGAKILAHSQDFDFTLGELSSMPPFSYYPYFAGWNSSDAPVFDIATIHHPAGNTKKISLDYDTLVPEPYIGGNSLLRVTEWDKGITQQGSSGGAIFNNRKQISGTLSLGDSYCGYPFNDYFVSFSFQFDFYNEPESQLKIWIDPDQNGVKEMEGTDPYKAIKEKCDTVPLVESASILKFKNGYYSGHNDDHFSEFAQLFKLSSEKDMPGFFVNTGKRFSSSENSYVNFIIREKTIEGTPGNSFFEQKIHLDNMIPDGVTFIDIPAIIKIKNDFFIGYEIFFDNPSDTFAVNQSFFADDAGQNYYINLAGEWVRIDKYTNETVRGSLDIRPVLCDSIPSVLDIITNKPVQYTLFPNPAKEYINLMLNPVPDSPVYISVFDLTGKLVYKEIVTHFINPGHLILKNFNPGIYITRITFADKVIACKFVIL